MDKNRKTLGIDLDDVTAELSEEALRLHNEDFPEIGLARKDLHCWEGNWDLLKDYFLKEGIYRNLGVMEGSQEVLKELNESFNILFITASPSVKATEEKLNWVEEHFPFLGHGNVIPTRYKYMVKADLLFDDSPEFLPKFENHRVLMDQPYNQGLVEGTDFEKRVENWYEFYEYVNGLYVERG